MVKKCKLESKLADWWYKSIHSVNICCLKKDHHLSLTVSLFPELRWYFNAKLPIPSIWVYSTDSCSVGTWEIVQVSPADTVNHKPLERATKVMRASSHVISNCTALQISTSAAVTPNLQMSLCRAETSNYSFYHRPHGHQAFFSEGCHTHDASHSSAGWV